MSRKVYFSVLIKAENNLDQVMLHLYIGLRFASFFLFKFKSYVCIDAITQEYGNTFKFAM